MLVSLLRNESPSTNHLRCGATLDIGGSTHGVTRFLLDGCAEPDVDSFLAGH